MPSREAARPSTKTVVELDLVGYSDAARTLQDQLGVEVVSKLNDKFKVSSMPA